MTSIFNFIATSILFMNFNTQASTTVGNGSIGVVCFKDQYIQQAQDLRVYDEVGNIRGY